MARLLTDGAEFGDIYFFDGNAGFSADTTNPRSGSYCYKVQVTTTVRQAIKNLPSSYSELYFRVGLNTTAYGTKELSWWDTSTELGSIRINSSGFLTAYVGTSTLVGTGTTIINPNVWYLIEVHIKIDDSSGVLEVRLDGNNEISFSGDTKPGTSSTINSFRLLYATGSGNRYYDDIAVNDTSGTSDNSWCGDGKVILLKPNAAGDVNQWSGSYADVDEIPADGDTTYVESSTTGDYSLYNIENPSLSGVSILRVWVEARARDTVADGGLISFLVKTGGTEHESSDVSLLTSYTRQLLGTAYTTNPTTSSNWTVSDLTSLQIGQKVKS